MANISDNNIRIPSTHLLDASFEELENYYECLQASEKCSAVPQIQTKQKFIDVYSGAVDSLLTLMDFPASDDQKYYSISTIDPKQKKTARQICENNTEVLFANALALATNQGPAQVDQLLLVVHDAIYWARRSGYSDDWIKTKLAEIQSTLEQGLKLPEEKSVTEPPKVITPAPAVASVALKKLSSPALQLYFSSQAGPAAVRELPAVTTYKTNNYTALNFHIGAQFTLGRTNLPPLMQTSGPTIDVGTSLIFGSTENLASSRYTIDGRIGWQQSLFALEVGDISFGGVTTARAGLARDYNKMNFGGGELPVPDTAWMFGASGMAGLNMCLPNSVCINVLGGYSYDHSLAGDTRYQTSYPTAELMLSFGAPNLNGKDNQP